MDTDADLDAYVAADPVGGQTHRATCRAMRPDPDAKETAWTAALDAAQTNHLAIAHAAGFWVPGQDAILAPYRTRYFTEALPILSTGQSRVPVTLTRTLYPLALADQATLDATETYLAEHDPSSSLGRVLLEQSQILRQAITAQAKAGQAG
jgi:aminopeptidase N